jgi:hypothetical protein
MPISGALILNDQDLTLARPGDREADYPGEREGGNGVSGWKLVIQRKKESPGDAGAEMGIVRNEFFNFIDQS